MSNLATANNVVRSVGSLSFDTEYMCVLYFLMAVCLLGMVLLWHYCHKSRVD